MASKESKDAIPPPDSTTAIELARRVFRIEADAILSLTQKLDDNFEHAVQLTLASRGRTIICGMGKSGIIGRKLAATLASTGTPSLFMHPAEAFHGDLGMVTPDDVFIALSYSGETDEVIKLLPFLLDNGNIIIAITGNPNSTLAKASRCHLNVAIQEEACPLQLAPTASTTATLAMGDALAVALMESRNFKPESFARFHPGGSLGRRLLSLVEHEMFGGEMPVVSADTNTIDVLRMITGSNLGLALVQLPHAWGIITDGDLRRALECHGNRIFEKTARDLMTLHPASVTKGTRVAAALEQMDRDGISSLLVTENGCVIGIFRK
ncbi:KpsF/GutQ family sugar-phosphate isomerase [Stenotrophomonas humi]